MSPFIPSAPSPSSSMTSCSPDKILSTSSSSLPSKGEAFHPSPPISLKPSVLTPVKSSSSGFSPPFSSSSPVCVLPASPNWYTSGVLSVHPVTGLALFCSKASIVLFDLPSSSTLSFVDCGLSARPIGLSWLLHPLHCLPLFFPSPSFSSTTPQGSHRSLTSLDSHCTASHSRHVSHTRDASASHTSSQGGEGGDQEGGEINKRSLEESVTGGERGVKRDIYLREPHDASEIPPSSNRSVKSSYPTLSHVCCCACYDGETSSSSISSSPLPVSPYRSRVAASSSSSSRSLRETQLSGSSVHALHSPSSSVFSHPAVPVTSCASKWGVRTPESSRILSTDAYACPCIDLLSPFFFSFHLDRSVRLWQFVLPPQKHHGKARRSSASSSSFTPSVSSSLHTSHLDETAREPAEKDLHSPGVSSLLKIQPLTNGCQLQSMTEELLARERGRRSTAIINGGDHRSTGEEESDRGRAQEISSSSFPRSSERTFEGEEDETASQKNKRKVGVGEGEQDREKGRAFCQVVQVGMHRNQHKGDITAMAVWGGGLRNLGVKPTRGSVARCSSPADQLCTTRSPNSRDVPLREDAVGRRDDSSSSSYQDPGLRGRQRDRDDEKEKASDTKEEDERKKEEGEIEEKEGKKDDSLICKENMVHEDEDKSKREASRRIETSSIYERRSAWGVCITGDKKGRLVIWHIPSFRVCRREEDEGRTIGHPHPQQQQGKITTFTPLSNQAIAALAVVKPCGVHTPPCPERRLRGTETIPRRLHLQEEEEGELHLSSHGKKEMHSAEERKTNSEGILTEYKTKVDKELENDLEDPNSKEKKSINLDTSTTTLSASSHPFDSILTAVGYTNGSVVLVEIGSQQILRILGRQGEEISTLSFVALPIPLSGRKSSPSSKLRTLAPSEKTRDDVLVLDPTSPSSTAMKASPSGEDKKEVEDDREVYKEEEEEEERKKKEEERYIAPTSADRVEGRDRREGLSLCLLSGSRDGQVFLWNLSQEISRQYDDEQQEDEGPHLLTTVYIGENKGGSRATQKGTSSSSGVSSRGKSEKTLGKPSLSSQGGANTRNNRDTQRQWLSSYWHPCFPSDIFFGTALGQLIHWRPSGISEVEIAGAGVGATWLSQRESSERELDQEDVFVSVSRMSIETSSSPEGVQRKLLQPHTRPIFSLGGFAFTLRQDVFEGKGTDFFEEANRGKKQQRGMKMERHLLLLSTSMDRTLCLTDINMTSSFTAIRECKHEDDNAPEMIHRPISLVEKEKIVGMKKSSCKEPLSSLRKSVRSSSPPHLNTSLLWQLHTLGGWITSLTLSPVRPSQLLIACGDSTIRSLDLLQLLHRQGSSLSSSHPPHRTHVVSRSHVSSREDDFSPSRTTGRMKEDERCQPCTGKPGDVPGMGVNLGLPERHGEAGSTCHSLGCSCSSISSCCMNRRQTGEGFLRQLEERGNAALHSCAVSSGFLWRGLLSSVECIAWHPLLSNVFAFGLGDGSFGVGVLASSSPTLPTTMTTSACSLSSSTAARTPGQPLVGRDGAGEGGGFNSKKSRFCNPLSMVSSTPQNDVVILSGRNPLQHKVSQLQWLLLPSPSWAIDEEGDEREIQSSTSLRQASNLSLSSGPVAGLMASPIPSALISGTDEGELLISTFSWHSTTTPSGSSYTENSSSKSKAFSRKDEDFENVRSREGVAPSGDASLEGDRKQKKRQEENKGKRASSQKDDSYHTHKKKSNDHFDRFRHVSPPTPVPLFMHLTTRDVRGSSFREKETDDKAPLYQEKDSGASAASRGTTSLVTSSQMQREVEGEREEEGHTKIEEQRGEIGEIRGVHQERLCGLCFVMKNTLSSQDIEELIESVRGELIKEGKDRYERSPSIAMFPERQKDHVQAEGEERCDGRLKEEKEEQDEERSFPSQQQKGGEKREDQLPSQEDLLTARTDIIEGYLRDLTSSNADEMFLCVVRPFSSPSPSFSPSLLRKRNDSQAQREEEESTDLSLPKAEGKKGSGEGKISSVIHPNALKMKEESRSAPRQKASELLILKARLSQRPLASRSRASIHQAPNDDDRSFSTAKTASMEKPSSSMANISFTLLGSFTLPLPDKLTSTAVLASPKEEAKIAVSGCCEWRKKTASLRCNTHDSQTRQGDEKEEKKTMNEIRSLFSSSMGLRDSIPSFCSFCMDLLAIGDASGCIWVGVWPLVLRQALLSAIVKALSIGRAISSGEAFLLHTANRKEPQQECYVGRQARPSLMAVVSGDEDEEEKETGGRSRGEECLSGKTNSAVVSSSSNIPQISSCSSCSTEGLLYHSGAREKEEEDSLLRSYSGLVISPSFLFEEDGRSSQTDGAIEQDRKRSGLVVKSVSCLTLGSRWLTREEKNKEEKKNSNEHNDIEEKKISLSLLTYAVGETSHKWEREILLGATYMSGVAAVFLIEPSRLFSSERIETGSYMARRIKTTASHTTPSSSSTCLSDNRLSCTHNQIPLQEDSCRHSNQDALSIVSKLPYHESDSSHSMIKRFTDEERSDRARPTSLDLKSLPSAGKTFPIEDSSEDVEKKECTVVLERRRRTADSGCVRFISQRSIVQATLVGRLTSAACGSILSGKQHAGGGGGKGLKGEQLQQSEGGALLACCWYEQPLPNRLILVLGGVEQTVILWDPLALPFYPPPRPIFSSSFSSPSVPSASTSLSVPSSSSAVSSTLSPSPPSQTAVSVSHGPSSLYIHPNGVQHTPTDSLCIATDREEGEKKSSLFHPSIHSSTDTSTAIPQESQLPISTQEISESTHRHPDDGGLQESFSKSPCEGSKQHEKDGDLGVNVRESDHRKQVKKDNKEEETERRRLWENDEGGLLPPWLNFASFSEAQLLRVLCNLLHAKKQRSLKVSLKKWVKEGDKEKEDGVLGSSSCQGGNAESCRREEAKRRQPFNRSGKGEDEQGRGVAQDKPSHEGERRRRTRDEEKDKEGDKREGEREDSKSDGGVAKGDKWGREEEDDRYMKEDERMRGLERVLLYYLSGEFSLPLSLYQSLPATASTSSSLHLAPEKRISSDISLHGTGDSSAPFFPSFSCDGYLSLIEHLHRYLVSQDKSPSSPWLRLLHLWLSSSSSSSRSYINGDTIRPPPSGDGLYSCLLLNGRLPWMFTSLDRPWKDDQGIAEDQCLSSSQPPAKTSCIPQEGPHVSSVSEWSPSSPFSTPTVHSVLDRDSPSPLFWLALAGSAGACDGRSPHAARAWRAVVCSFVNHRLKEVERATRQREARLPSSIIHECAALLLSVGASQKAIEAYRRCRLYGHALLLACLTSPPKPRVLYDDVPPSLHLAKTKKRETTRKKKEGKSEALERISADIHSHEEFKQQRKGLSNQEPNTVRDERESDVKGVSYHRNKHGELDVEKNMYTGDRQMILRELKEARKQQPQRRSRRCQQILFEWAEALAKKGHRLAACVAVASADAWLVASSLLLEEVSFSDKTREERRQHTFEKVDMKISETVKDSRVMEDLHITSRKLTLLVLATLCAIRGSDFGVAEDRVFDQKDSQKREEGEEDDEDCGIESEEEEEESLTSYRGEETAVEEDDSDEKEEEEEEEEDVIGEEIHHVRYAERKTCEDLREEDHDPSFKRQPMRRRTGSSVKRKTASYPALTNAVTSHFSGLMEQSYLVDLQAHANHINLSPQKKPRESLHDAFISYLVRTRPSRTVPSKTQQECAEVMWRVALVPLHLRLAAYLADLGSSFAEQAFHVTCADWISKESLRCWHSTVQLFIEQDKKLKRRTSYSSSLIALLLPLLNLPAEKGSFLSTDGEQGDQGKAIIEGRGEIKPTRKDEERQWNSSRSGGMGADELLDSHRDFSPDISNHVEHKKMTEARRREEDEEEPEEEDRKGLEFVRQALQGHRAVFASHWCLACLQKELSVYSHPVFPTEGKTAAGATDSKNVYDEARSSHGGVVSFPRWERQTVSRRMTSVGLELLLSPFLDLKDQVISQKRDDGDDSSYGTEKGSISPLSLCDRFSSTTGDTKREVVSSRAAAVFRDRNSEVIDVDPRLISLLEDLEKNVETYLGTNFMEEINKKSGNSSHGIDADDSDDVDDHDNRDEHRFECTEGGKKEEIKHDTEDTKGEQKSKTHGERVDEEMLSSFVFEIHLYRPTYVGGEGTGRSRNNPRRSPCFVSEEKEHEETEKAISIHERQRKANSEIESKRDLLKSSVLLTCALLLRCQLTPSPIEFLRSSFLSSSSFSPENKELIENLLSNLRGDNPLASRTTCLDRQTREDDPSNAPHERSNALKGIDIGVVGGQGRREVIRQQDEEHSERPEKTCSNVRDRFETKERESSCSFRNDERRVGIEEVIEKPIMLIRLRVLTPAIKLLLAKISYRPHMNEIPQNALWIHTAERLLRRLLRLVVSLSLTLNHEKKSFFEAEGAWLTLPFHIYRDV